MLGLANEITFSPIIVGAMRLGIWGVNYSTEKLEKFIDACIDMGLKDFDHADIYGDYTTERAFGRVLARRPELRREIQITTKCGIHQGSELRPDIPNKAYDSSATHILKSVENSLRNLSTDHIDVLLLHRPDHLMNPIEIAEAFNTLHQSGKVLAFGVSNFSARQMALLSTAVPISTHQLELSIFHLDAFENGDLDYTYQLGIIPTAWSPLAGGKFFSDTDEQSIRVRRTINTLLEKYNCTIDQLAISWLHTHPAGIIPVLGTSKVERLASAIKGLEFKLDRFDWYALWQASTGRILA